MTHRAPSRPWTRRGVGAPIAVAGLLCLLYAPTCVNIARVYLGPESFYTHGFLIPFACLLLLREKRGRLARIPPSSSAWGISLLLLGCALHLFGLRASVGFASAVSILIVIIGLSLYHRGKEYTREILPAAALLLFMIPLPQWLLYHMTFSLKMRAAALASAVVRAFGVPVLRDGIYVTCPGGASFAIEDPCSGLRSIVSLCAMAYILSALAELPARKQLLILASAPLLAWAGNLLRVVCTILLVHFTGCPGPPFVHAAVGAGSFIFSLLVLLLWSTHILCADLRGGSR